VLLALMRRASEDGVELPTDDMFAIYHKIKELWDLYRQIVQKYVFLCYKSDVLEKLDLILKRSLVPLLKSGLRRRILQQ
jgi:hypothetical protein